MYELTFLSPVYRIARDIWSLTRGLKRRLTPAQIVALRTKWKPEFESKIFERRRKGLREDIIIRDMRRVDQYPNAPEDAKGISPWFRIGLIGTYHRGVEAGLHWQSLVKDPSTNQWRYPNHKADEIGELNVLLVGYIPYENIESVDWEGDEYYGFPHVYCYFDTKRKEPYEALAFCEKRHLDDHNYYSKVVDYDPVAKLSKKRGIEY